MNAHTPGPWTFDEHGGTFYVFGQHGAMVADGEGGDEHVARIRGVGRRASIEEQRANAALIAASPRMGADLSAALELLRLAQEHCPCSPKERLSGHLTTCWQGQTAPCSASVDDVVAAAEATLRAAELLP